MSIEDTPTQFPEALGFLFEPMRYKVAYGGRGSGKSWSFARALLLRCLSTPTRVLCAREVQRSIKESVHRLLADQIDMLDLGEYFEVLSQEIRGPNGSSFVFTGLADHTVDSLKSYEGVDICWVEEAHTITDTSFKILIPTIRAQGSEIWLSFNPQLETDPVYARFVTDPPPDCISVKVNYNQNPWFGQTTMPAELRHAKRTMDPDTFAHVWLGECMPAVEGAIYFRAMAAMENSNRIGKVPHDPMLKTHIVFDLGYNDAMSIGLVQKASSEVRIIHYIEDRQRTLTDYSQELKSIRFNGERPQWGTMYLPHDGYAKRHQTGEMDADLLSRLGWNVAPKGIMPSLKIEKGINRAQQMFPRVYIDESCTRLIECLKRYRWNLNAKTQEGMTPLHDEFSHGADMFRYLALIEDDMRNDDTWGSDIDYPELGYA